MINDGTLEKLNSLGFGLDIDKIETYLTNYKAVEFIANGLSRYRYNHDRLREIFKELKPMSRVFNNDSSSDISYNKYNELFTLINNDNNNLLYGRTDDNKLKDIKDNTLLTDSDVIDIVGIEDIDGIKLSIVYRLGEIGGVYCISDRNMLLDITDLVTNTSGTNNSIIETIPTEIEQLKSYDLVDIRGILYTEQEFIDTNSICDTMGHIRTKNNLGVLRFKADNIFIASSNSTQDTQEQDNTSEQSADIQNNQNEQSTKYKASEMIELQVTKETKHYWKKLNYLKKIGFSMPAYSLLRNIDSSTFEQAVYTFADYFNAKGITRFKVRNIRDTSNSSILTYDLGYVDSSYIFDTVITDIIYTGKIKVVDTECNNSLKIKEIHIGDIYEIEERGLKIGDRIAFRVIEQEAELV